MKKGALLITNSLIVIISLSACGMLQDQRPGDSAEIGMGLSSAEGYPLVDICDLGQDRVGEDVRAVGTINFMDENAEGTFAEISEGGCKVGAFVPQEMWELWEPDMQAALNMDNTIEAWGTLVSFDGELIINLSGIMLFEEAETAQDVNRVENVEENEEELVEETREYTLPEAPESALLDVPLIYSGYDGMPGVCYLGSAGMLVKYEHPELDFADITALSGMGSSALHMDYPDMPSMLISPYTTQSVVFMMNNLGADFVVGFLENGKGSDPYQPISLPFEDNATHQLSFSDSAEALTVLKQAIGSGKPVMVYLNLYHVHDDFAETSEFWRDILGKDHAAHYMVIKGYDADTFYFNDPTDPTAAADDLTANMEHFLLAWEDTTEIVNEPGIGPFWMVFIDTSGEVPSTEEVIDLNLEKAVDAPAEIRKFAENPDNSEFTRFMLLELGNARINFGEFLIRNGYEEAGDLYIQSGTLLSDMAINMTVDTETLLEVADLEEAALILLLQ